MAARALPSRRADPCRSTSSDTSDYLTDILYRSRITPAARPLGIKPRDPPGLDACPRSDDGDVEATKAEGRPGFPSNPAMRILLFARNSALVRDPPERRSSGP